MGLVKVVVDRLAGDCITKSDFNVLLVVDVALTRVVVEVGSAAFILKARGTDSNASK